MVDKSLLIVWVYFPAVGHLIEAIEVAANYKKLNPDLKIHILVHQDTPYHIGNYCDFIEAMHSLDLNHYQENIKISNDLSSEGYDYVLFQKRLKYTPQDFPKPLLVCNLYLQEYFKAKIWSGFDDTYDSDPQALKAQAYSPFRIKIPKEKITFRLPESSYYPKIAILLKGASQQTVWPERSFWKVLCRRILKDYPNAVFLITGISSVHKSPKIKIEKVKHRIDRYIESIPQAINCYDVGLENQLGIIERADVFLAPHSGFSFLAPCLGTPWLALSGGEWAEHMPAKQPFYSVLPTCKKYPCNNGDMKLECKVRLKIKQPIKCMSDLSKKYDDILFGLKKLLSKDYSYEESFRDYENSAIRNNVHLEKIWRLTNFKNS